MELHKLAAACELLGRREGSPSRSSTGRRVPSPSPEPARSLAPRICGLSASGWSTRTTFERQEYGAELMEPLRDDAAELPIGYASSTCRECSSGCGRGGCTARPMSCC